MRCSVVIATAGSADGISRTLDALADQTILRNEYEIIVVDNNQDDAGSTSLERTTDGYEVRIVREARRGAAAARNAGTLAAQGDVVVFVDDDTEVNPEFLEAHLGAHADGATVAVGVITEHNAHSTWFRRYLTERRVVNRIPDPAGVDWRNFYGANASVRRSAFIAVGGFDPDLIRREDAELGYRLMNDGAQFALASGAVGRHHSSFGPRDHLRRSYWNGYYLAMLFDKHPELVEHEDMTIYRWRYLVLSAVVAPVLAVVGVLAYPLTPWPLFKGITGLVLVRQSWGFHAYRTAIKPPSGRSRRRSRQPSAS